MTDKQIFMAIKRLDRRLMSIRQNNERAISELADLINAIHELRADRNDWREEAKGWRQGGEI